MQYIFLRKIQCENFWNQAVCTKQHYLFYIYNNDNNNNKIMIITIIKIYFFLFYFLFFLYFYIFYYFLFFLFFSWAGLSAWWADSLPDLGQAWLPAFFGLEAHVGLGQAFQSSGLTARLYLGLGFQYFFGLEAHVGLGWADSPPLSWAGSPQSSRYMDRAQNLAHPQIRPA